MRSSVSLRVRSTFLAAAVFLSLSTANAADTPATQPATRPAPPPNVLANNTIEHFGIPYAKHDPTLNVLDLYAPKDAKNAPVLLFVHGGEWSRGDKQPVSYKPQFFNSHGIIFITINYRLSPKDPHPAQVNDVAESIAWTHDHIAEYGGDPHKIVILGHSAGCHLVTYVGLNPEPLAAVHMKPSDLKGVVAWSGGMYDLVARVQGPGLYPPFIKATFGDSFEAQRAGSPMTYAANAKNSPPFLIASTDDAKSGASRDASTAMIKAINDAGGTASSLILEGRDHRGALEQLGAPDDNTGPALLEFIEKVTR